MKFCAEKNNNNLNLQSSLLPCLPLEADGQLHVTVAQLA